MMIWTLYFQYKNVFDRHARVMKVHVDLDQTVLGAVLFK